MDVPAMDVPARVIFLPRESRHIRPVLMELANLLLALAPRMNEEERWRIQLLVAEVIQLSQRFSQQAAVIDDDIDDSDDDSDDDGSDSESDADDWGMNAGARGGA